MSKYDDFQELARQLYGYGWQTAISVEYQINDRTVRRWVSGKTILPDWVINDLLEKKANNDYQVIMGVLTSQRRIAAGHPLEICLVYYKTDADLFEITGDRLSAHIHLNIILRISTMLRKVGIEPVTVPIDAKSYFSWLGTRTNDASRRSQYAVLITKEFVGNSDKLTPLESS